MKNTKKHLKAGTQRLVQVFEGGLIIFLICLSIVSSFDLSIFIYCIAINQIQYAFTEWCPITSFFNNIIGFLNYKEKKEW